MSQQDGIDRPPAFPKRLAAALDRIEALERELAEVTEEYAEYRNCNVAEFDLDKAERDALKARVAELEGTVRHRDRQITAIVDWLTTNQDDVFRRGLWDAIPKNLTAAETTGDDNAKG